VNFNFLEYLDSKGISYTEYSEWTNITCPFCDDGGQHLGINIIASKEYPNGGYHCWRCDKSGTVITLLQEIEKTSKEHVLSIIAEFPNYGRKIKDSVLPFSGGFTLPYEVKDLQDKHKKYLIQRGFDPKHISKVYKVKGGGIFGLYKFSLIIPIYQNYELVNFLSRDISGKRDKKYLVCPNDKSKLNIKDCIYNIDNITSDVIIITEGVTDVWKLGSNTVGTFGIQFTEKQVNILRTLKVKKAYVLYDNEPQAVVQGKKLASMLSPFYSVESVTLKVGDPGDLKVEEVEYLKKELGV